ncbi:MAG: carbon storage regulator CsrA [Bdellovibrionales bacterium]|nr:carbon storage regulator CsrA [Bdellovibrionales bacterium]
MLVLTRKIGDSILIGDSIKIQVVNIKGCQVRLGIEAPKETKIFRQEVLENIKKNLSSPPIEKEPKPIQTANL